MKRILVFAGIITSLLGVAATTLFSQAYEGKSCTKYSNPDLAKQLKEGNIPDLKIESVNYLSTDQDWATSSLKPDVKKPVRHKEEEDFDYTERVDRWTCLYSPYSAHDTDTATAWVEGVSGDGIGEVLVIQANVDAPLEIWAGIGASQSLFTANNRPRMVRVYVLAGKEEDMVPGCQYSMMKYKNIRVLAKGEIELKDVNGYQDLPLPKHAALREGETGFVALEILSVYRGTKYRDTAITEIRVK